VPSGQAISRAVMIITPRSPVFTSLTSSVWEWYIHITELHAVVQPVAP